MDHSSANRTNPLAQPELPIGDDQALIFRMVTHVTSSIFHEVGDAEDHLLSLARFSGLAFFPADSVATVSFVAATDYVRGEGDFVLYPIITFDDGSALHLKSTGVGTVTGSVTRFTGSATVLGGKGRFAGARGGGTLTGTRYTPLAAGADLVSDYRIKVTA